jgi:endonuclease YncB( thermonuclease family)
VVVRVLDGDTFDVRVKKGIEATIHLWGVDAPELDQPFGKEAKDCLSRLLLKKYVVIEDYTGRNGVVVREGEVFVESNKPPKQDNVNLVMVSAGLGWWQRLPENQDLRSNQEALNRAEESARAAKRGLWSKPGAVPPWEWKKRKSSGG